MTLNPQTGESLVLMCGCCALVCSDPPVVSGYRTNTTLIEVLGGNGVEFLHGDDPQQTSVSPLLRLVMLATSLVTPAQFIVKNRLLHNRELRLRQFHRAVCTIHKWIGGAENRQCCGVSGLICKAHQVFEQP